ncbi:class I SAM-dependent methyltransferase [candidate division KSB1 bacterium]|nr:class I SAM-dependent methyltransferase [candidate division KSB1 bacterium]RQW05612.1 MAG: class I SAM-dependent methyltransferase [candidate division KSB1 bacterium]
MDTITFDEFANKYDSWFLKNKNVLDSEVALLAFFLKNPGRVISIGCGSGLFEKLLQQDYGIEIKEGIEPAAGMREIAIKRGMDVRPGTAEDVDLEACAYDTIIFNGTASYIKNLQKAFENAYHALKPGGQLLVLDVPKESSYGLLYNLGREIGSWDHRYFIGAVPENVYPVEFVLAAIWRSTPEKVELLRAAGFTDFKFGQTLTKHPLYSNREKENPIEGYDRGDYVCICARR